MNNLFELETINLIKDRIEQLDYSAQPLWGKMNVAQMLAHCTYAIDMASGKINPPRLLIGRVIGPFFKSTYSNDKVFSKGSPTDKMIEVTDERNFEREKKLLFSYLEKRDKMLILIIQMLMTFGKGTQNSIQRI